jgi:hypothetical protein
VHHLHRLGCCRVQTVEARRSQGGDQQAADRSAALEVCSAASTFAGLPLLEGLTEPAVARGSTPRCASSEAAGFALWPVPGLDARAMQLHCTARGAMQLTGACLTHSSMLALAYAFRPPPAAREAWPPPTCMRAGCKLPAAPRGARWYSDLRRCCRTARAAGGRLGAGGGRGRPGGWPARRWAACSGAGSTHARRSG